MQIAYRWRPPLCHLPLEVTFSSSDIFWYARSASLFCCAKKRPYEVSAISMGAFLSASSSVWSFSVHGAGILTSSDPPSANCWYSMHLLATIPILDTETPFHRSSASSSLLVSYPTLFSSSFSRRSRMGSAALRLR